MKLFYDFSSQQWYHRNHGPALYFGADSTKIPFKDEIPSPSLSILANFQEGHLLTVGIMTCRNKNNTFGIAGNLPLFYDLHHDLAKHGIFSYIFTAEDAIAKKNIGLIYSLEHEKWMKVTVPSPCIVYNRIPFRTFEESGSFKTLSEKFKDQKIIMFNPGFLHKHEMFQALATDSELATYLPETILLSSRTKLYTFLQNYQQLYLKPAKGNRGSGIFVLSMNREGEISVKRPGSVEHYVSIDSYWNLESKRLLRKKYIAQRAIIPKKMGGHRYDYRILAHYENGAYKVTGKAVRISQTQEITTHIPKGGKLYPYTRLQTSDLDSQIEWITQHCGEVLSKKMGFFGEFSIDIGEDRSGRLFIFEVNAKPMQFDEIEIEASRLKQLKKLFIELGTPKKPPK